MERLGSIARHRGRKAVKKADREEEKMDSREERKYRRRRAWKKEG